MAVIVTIMANTYVSEHVPQFAESTEEFAKTNQHLRILTPYKKGNHPAWLQNVELYEGLASEVAHNWSKPLPPLYRIWRELRWAWRLFDTSKKYDLVLTGSDRVGLFFGAAQQCFRRRKVHHIYLDFYVNVEGGIIEASIRRIFYGLAARGASYVIVQRNCETALYSQTLWMPASRFPLILYHATIFDTPSETGEGGYIFSGGDSDRDYPLLIEAVRELPYRVVIAALRRDHFAGLTIPSNVEIITASAAEFLKLVGNSSLVVVPLKKRPQHVGGEQTYANAMTMGKPTIVTDLGATDYIVDGQTGFLTPAGDVAALRRAIERTMQDRILAQTVGKRAKEASAAFKPERFFADVFRLCEECAGHAQH